MTLEQILTELNTIGTSSAQILNNELCISITNYPDSLAAIDSFLNLYNAQLKNSYPEVKTFVAENGSIKAIIK
jgi:hypothetical protein